MRYFAAFLVFFTWFASAGMGSASHLAGELFKSMAKVGMTHVPYKGNVPAIADLLAGAD